jgi:hypothetical protein
VIAGVSSALGCNEDRQQECHAFVEAVKPLEAPAGNEKMVPTLDAVNGVKKQVESLKLQDQPLVIYRSNYVKTLAVLVNTLEVKSSSMPPDGADDVIKKNLKEARADAADVRKYCSN